MKHTIRILAVLLVAVMLLTMAPVQPLFNTGVVMTASAAAKPEKVSGLKITTANKKQLLKLTWTKQANAAGYQIYRSTTGKSGSFQKVATVRDKTVHVDKNLKSATTYYYKVRAFAKQNGSVVYGAFAKANLSTRVTASYIKKKFNYAFSLMQTYGVMPRDVVDTVIYYDYNDGKEPIYLPSVDSKNPYFYKISFGKVKTKADLKKILSTTFSDEIVKNILKHYVERNGQLYKHAGDAGDAAWTHLEDTKVTITNYSDRKITAKVKTAYYFDASDISWWTDTQTMNYQNGKWLLSNAKFWIFYDPYL